MTILKSLDDSSIVRSYVVHEFRHWSKGSFYRIAAFLTDNTILHIKEYAAESDRFYSFHWQQNNGEMIMRWDNSPHHKQISTFPHHFHRDSEIAASTAVGLGEVLGQIERLIEKPDSMDTPA